MVDQWITDEAALNRRFARYTNDLNEDQKKDLEQKWVSFRNVASSKQRLEAIVLISKIILQKYQREGFKAMFATNSKVEAVRFKNFLMRVV